MNCKLQNDQLNIDTSYCEYMFQYKKIKYVLHECIVFREERVSKIKKKWCNEMAEIRLPLQKGTKVLYYFPLSSLFRGLSISSHMKFFRQDEFYNTNILNYPERIRIISDDKTIIAIVINNILLIIK